MMVDVGEMEIERLKKTETLLQWQAKMPQDERTVASGVWTGQIICTAVDKGITHEFKLLQPSRVPFVKSQLCLADGGYQGFSKRHATNKRVWQYILKLWIYLSTLPIFLLAT